MVPPSRIRHRCGYKGCKFQGEWRNYPRHQNSVHGGDPIVLLNDAFGVGGRWHTWVNSSAVVDGAAGSSQDPGIGGNPAEEDTTSGQQNLLTDDNSGISPQQQGHSTSEEQQCEAPSSSQRSDAAPTSEVRALAKRVEAIEKVQAGLLQQSRQDQRKPNSGSASLQTVRCIGSLVASTGNQLTVMPDKNLAFCKVCVRKWDDTLLEKKMAGILRYDFAVGTVFENENLPTKFRSLKLAVKTHWESAGHQKAEDALKRQDVAAAARMDVASNVAKRVLRLAYRVLKKSLSHETFEELIVTQFQGGCDMGNINHSKRLMVDARNAFSEVMLDKLAEHIATQPCVGLVVDKVTVNRRTLDITAIVTINPEAKPGKMIRSMVIGAPVVEEHDGDALAEEIRTTLATVGIRSSDQLSAISADGQYHHLHVPQKLLSVMAKEAGEPPGTSGRAAVPFVWDSAHLMNLADADARKACSWVDDVVELVSDISRRFTGGKGLVDLGKASAKLGVKLLQPTLPSTTRFAPHAAKTFRAFENNVRAMSAVLDAKPASGSGPTAALLRHHQDMLKDAGFLARVAALHDIYEVLATGSKGVQNLQGLPWEVSDAFQKTIVAILWMRTSLEVSVKPTSALTTSELTEKVKFDLRWPHLSKSKNLKVQAADVIAFCSALAEALKSRRDGASASGDRKGTANKALVKAMPDIRTVGDLRAIRMCKAPAQVGLIVEAMDRLIACGHIPRSARAPRSSVHAAYDLLQKVEGEACSQTLLKLLLRQQKTDRHVKPFTDLVIRVWLLCPPESVVESMGSVLKVVFGEHRQLNHANAAKELVIRWNGPHPLHCDSLVNLVQRRRNFNFTKRSGIKRSLEGTVIRRRMAIVCDLATL